MNTQTIFNDEICRLIKDKHPMGSIGIIIGIDKCECGRPDCKGHDFQPHFILNVPPTGDAQADKDRVQETLGSLVCLFPELIDLAAHKIGIDRATNLKEVTNISVEQKLAKLFAVLQSIKFINPEDVGDTRQEDR